VLCHAFGVTIVFPELGFWNKLSGGTIREILAREAGRKYHRWTLLEPFRAAAGNCL
jgi:hypothetical protein